MTAPPPFRSNHFLRIVLSVYALVWIATAIGPRDWLTWALENLLVVIVVGVLVATYRRFAFSNLSYLLVAIFLSLHAVGAHSGYMHTPLGDWLKNGRLGLARKSVRSRNPLRVWAAPRVSGPRAFDPQRRGARMGGELALDDSHRRGEHLF